MASDVDRFVALEKTREQLKTKKIRLEEQYKAKKQLLTELVQKIKKAGHDPSKLKQVIEEKEKELNKQISAFEADVEKASAALSGIEV